MSYFISFLEGIITFISPCLLPMLPVYLSYFAGQSGEGQKQRALINAIGFVGGFTLIFVLMGAFAGAFGGFLNEYRRQTDFVLGIIIILFGLSFLGIIRLPFSAKRPGFGIKGANMSFLKAAVFGMVFSIAWTPCVSAFLGSALMLAASQGESLKGVLMLLSFSMGLGIPFILAAVLIDWLKNAFDFIKANYRIINLVSGLFLVLMGIIMAAGLMNYILGFTII